MENWDENYPHGLSGYTPGKGFSIYGKTEPVPAGDAVDMAVQILGIAITFADWRPSPEQRTTLANFLTTEAVGDRAERIAAASSSPLR
jgi:hypothetical protein